MRFSAAQPSIFSTAWLCSSAGAAQRTTSTCRVGAGTSKEDQSSRSEGRLKCTKHLSGGGKRPEATIGVSGLQLRREDQRTLVRTNVHLTGSTGRRPPH